VHFYGNDVPCVITIQLYHAGNHKTNAYVT